VREHCAGVTSCCW